MALGFVLGADRRLEGLLVAARRRVGGAAAQDDRGRRCRGIAAARRVVLEASPSLTSAVVKARFVPMIKAALAAKDDPMAFLALGDIFGDVARWAGRPESARRAASSA